MFVFAQTNLLGKKDYQGNSIVCVLIASVGSMLAAGAGQAYIEFAQ